MGSLKGNLMPNDTETKPSAPLALANQANAPITSPFSGDNAFTGAQRMAKALASSELMPQAYRNNIPNTLIAMELAHRTGASVMMVAQNLDIIHGRPSWRAQFLIATVNACGRFTPLRFRFQGEEGKPDWGCRAVARERETNEECIGPLITLKMAADEGWPKKNGSKWLTMPELMLTYRAAAFWARTNAPELSLGIQTTEEVIDMHGAMQHELPEQLAPQGAAALEAVLGVSEPTAQTAEIVNAETGEVEVVQESEPKRKPKRGREPGDDDGPVQGELPQ